MEHTIPRRTILNVTVSPDIKNRLEIRAIKENRPISNLVEIILRDFLEKEEGIPVQLCQPRNGRIRRRRVGGIAEKELAELLKSQGGT